jgi:hypothetical protein
VFYQIKYKFSFEIIIKVVIEDVKYKIVANALALMTMEIMQQQGSWLVVIIF